jgi:hypothetical protein
LTGTSSETEPRQKAIRLRTVGLLIVLAIAISVGVISTRRSGELGAALEACGAVETGDWSTVLSLTEDLMQHTAARRSASECRCVALIATGNIAECETLMEELLTDPSAPNWVPSPMLSVHMIQTRRLRGEAKQAAALARRSAMKYPEDGDLFYLELTTRIAVENEEQVLEELSARIDPASRHATRMRVSLATRYLIRGQPDQARAVLGTDPRQGSRDEIERWYDTMGMALATARDLPGVRRTYAAWHAAGGNAVELQARYALTLSISNLTDPDRSSIELLTAAASAAEGVVTDDLLEAVVTRLVLTLVQSDEQNEALAVYDRYRGRFEMSGLVREELERSQVQKELASGRLAPQLSVVRFEIVEPASGTELLLSPAHTAAVDSDYQRLAVAPDGLIETTRAVGGAPLRWVYRDAQQRVLASGTAVPKIGVPIAIPIETGAPQPSSTVELTRRPADGKRKLVVLIVDCGDWRLIQYLRARGELPTLDGLLRTGFHAVLDSDPPMTAAALEALVRPGGAAATSFVGLVHQLGVELAGLASIGENPFDVLSWVLPEQTDLFDVIGAGDHIAANLLFSHGGIDAGRHSELTGPNGVRRRLPIETSGRDLRPDERVRWPDLDAATVERDAVHLRSIAAEFDNAEQIVAAGEVDFLALRIEGFDILTHAFFAHTTATRQDDADGFLYELYRYVDARLADTHNLLDADDVLIVMSDHGIRTSMEHSRHALFVATGAGVPIGRAPGNPALRGVSVVLADLMGIETDWPRTGVAPWTSSNARSNTRSNAQLSD